MDEKDIEILMAICRLGNGSPDSIAEETGIPKSTVHYRIDNLRESGVIKDDLFSLDLDKIGFTITVISEVLANYDEEYHDNVGKKLAEINGVEQVYFTMGDTDFIVIARLSSRDMVEDLITSYESIDEIERTSSKFVITTVKNAPNKLTNYDYESVVRAVEES